MNREKNIYKFLRLLYYKMVKKIEDKRNIFFGISSEDYEFIRIFAFENRLSKADVCRLGIQVLKEKLKEDFGNAKEKIIV